MRVITGTAKGRRLKTVEGTELVRPTSDRVKEAIFSIIQFDIPGSKVLDLFAGSGQLGIEALSRGAALCVFTDSSRTAQEVVKDNLKSTGLFSAARVVGTDAAAFLSGTRDNFDIALLDPPYHQELIPAVLPSLVERMSARGIIICEHAADEHLPEECGSYAVAKRHKFGKIMLSVYRRTASAAQERNDANEDSGMSREL